MIHRDRNWSRVSALIESVAMERADRNIAEMLETLRLTFNRERQQNIDEELFDLISGFEALSQQRM